MDDRKLCELQWLFRNSIETKREKQVSYQGEKYEGEIRSTCAYLHTHTQTRSVKLSDELKDLHFLLKVWFEFKTKEIMYELQHWVCLYHSVAFYINNFKTFKKPSLWEAAQFSQSLLSRTGDVSDAFSVVQPQQPSFLPVWKFKANFTLAKSTRPIAVWKTVSGSCLA